MPSPYQKPRQIGGTLADWQSASGRDYDSLRKLQRLYGGLASTSTADSLLHDLHSNESGHVRSRVAETARSLGFDPMQSLGVGELMLANRLYALPPEDKIVRGESAKYSPNAGVVSIPLAPAGGYLASLMGPQAVFNHEGIEHHAQSPMGRMAVGSRMRSFSTEVPAGLGDTVFLGELARRSLPAKSANALMQHQVDYPSGKHHPLSWMIRQAKQHDYFNGRSMTNLLATPEGQQYLRSVTSNPPGRPPSFNQPAYQDSPHLRSLLSRTLPIKGE